MNQKRISSSTEGPSPQLTPKMLERKLLADYSLPIASVMDFSQGKRRMVKCNLSASGAVYTIQQIAAYFGKTGRNLYSLRDLSVLDLACGSNQCMDGFDRFEYQPHFARAFAEIGSKIVGVDVLSNQSERFESVQIDLLQPGALGPIVFASVSFDVVRMRQFLSVWPIDHPLYLPGDFWPEVEIGSKIYQVSANSPALKSQIRDTLSTDGFSLFVDSLLGNLSRILNENGLLLFEGSKFVKHNGELESVELPKL